MYNGRKYTLPSIKSLMRKIAVQHGIPEQAANTWEHSLAVYLFADKIASLAEKEGYKIDRDFIKTACFCHDIGRMVTGSAAAKIFKDAIYHGIEGYKILKKADYPEKLARVCLVHTGGTGIDEITNRKYKIFNNRSTLAETIEEKIIAYADVRTDYSRKKKKDVQVAFIKAYNRFKIYPRVGPRLLKNHQFIQKITKGQIK